MRSPATASPYIWYDGEMWAIFYEEIDATDRLPRVLTEDQVAQPGSEVARVPPGVRRDRPDDPAGLEDRPSRMPSICST